MTVRELKQLANTMTGWQHALTKSMGPLFSDPLRALKRIIKQATTDEGGAQGEEKGSDGQGQDRQRADKRKRTAEDSAGGQKQQAGDSGKRVRDEQLPPGGEDSEQKSGAD